MELRLEQMIASLETVSDIRNLQPNNPIIVRLSHPTNATVHVIALAYNEPYQQVLPINVTWFDFNPQSPNYRRALRRESKVSSGGFQHSWRIIDTYDEVFVHQEYDAIDTEFLTNVQSVPAASVTVLGTVKLSHAPTDPANPVVVVEGDPRLSDARPPRSHSHPQQPAQQLKTSTGVVNISGSGAPEVGAVLIATSPNSAEWRRLTTTDIR
jgi:hypothetical protein